MDFIRVLLKPDATRITETGARAGDRIGWKDAGFTRVTMDEPYMKWWTSQDKQTVIRFIRDPLREIRYSIINPSCPVWAYLCSLSFA